MERETIAFLVKAVRGFGLPVEIEGSAGRGFDTPGGAYDDVIALRGADIDVSFGTKEFGRGYRDGQKALFRIYQMQLLGPDTDARRLLT